MTAKTASPKTLVLIDGHYHIYRSFFAFGTRPLTNSEGQRVETAYTIANLLWTLFRTHRDDYLWAIAMDGSEPTFRHDAFPEYKANRDAMPQELVDQLPWVRTLIEGFRIPVLRAKGFEADDLIATAATRAAEAGFNVVIYSKDKDLEQVLSDRVKLLREPKTGQLYGPEELLAKKSIRPDQVIDYQALCGDTSDNIPGVRGVGPKTAVKVLEALEKSPETDLEDLLQDPVPEGVPPAALKKIRANPDDLKVSRMLVELRQDAPVEPIDDRFRMVEPQVEALRPICMKLGFQKMLRELEDSFGTEPAGQQQGELFGEDPEEDAPPAASPGRYELITREEDLQKALDACRRAGRFAFDTETSSADPIVTELVGFSLSWEPEQGVYCPVSRPDGEPDIPRDRVLQLLKPILEDASVTKVGHNLKFDAQVMLRLGILLQGIACDTMVAAYLLNPTGGSYKLDTLVAERFRYSMTPISRLIGTGDEERSMADLPPEEIRDYAAEDADFSLRVANVLDADVDAAELRRVSDEIESPLVTILARMEHEGITLDPSRLEELEAEVTTAVQECETKVHEAAGGQFNIGSPKQLQDLLFEQLGLEPVRKTKTGLSTSADVLEELTIRYPDQPVPALVLEYRMLSKLLNTYIQALPKLVKPETGRIHTDLRQTVAATGRLASNQPNLQNIPIKTELGRRIRRAFVPNRTGHVFMSADYSQIELRLLAHFSGDPELQRAMSSGADIHSAVAARIGEKSPDDVTREERSAAKAVTFGVIYGMGAFGLARDLGISRGEAKEFIDTFFQNFPGVREFIDSTIARAHDTLEVRTLFGRRRPLPELGSRMVRDRKQGERYAVNTVVQGSAADLIKKAMIDVQAHLDRTDSPVRMLLQIHDELLFEIPAERLEVESPILQGLMVDVLDLDVPLAVNASAGEDWYDASK